MEGGATVLKEKNIVVCILLSFITCGIYGIIWFVNMTDDVAFASHDRSISGGKAFLFSIITCGIYFFYWNYKMGQLSYKVKSTNGLSGGDNSVLYLILSIFGLSLVNYCLIQSDINEFSKISLKA